MCGFSQPKGLKSMSRRNAAQGVFKPIPPSVLAHS